MKILKLVSFFLAAAQNKVIRSTLIYTLAGGLNAAIPFFILPILTFYLTPEEYGVVSTFMVFNSIFLIVIGMEQYTYVAVNFYTQPTEIIQSYITNITTISLSLFLLVFVLVFSFPGLFEDLSKIRAEWVLFSVIVAFFQFLSQLSLTVWQLNNDPLRYGLFQVGHSLFNYGLSIFLIVQFSLGESGRLVGIAVAAILFGLYGFYYLVRNNLIRRKIDYRVIRAAVFFSLPLIPHAFAGWVNTALDRIIINHHISVAATGIYSVYFQIAMVIGLLASSFNKAFIPFIFKTLSAGDKAGKLHLVRYTYLYYACLTAFAIVLAVAAPSILRLLVDEEYHQNQKIIYWIILGFTADGFYYGVINYLFYSKKTVYISMITFSSCLIHFLISFILIPRYGVVAAAWSTAFSFIFTFVAALVVSNKVFPMPWLQIFTEKKQQNYLHE